MSDEANGHDHEEAPHLGVPSCSNCVFWFGNQDRKSGTCRRRAPVPVIVGMQQIVGPPKPLVNAFFPPTAATILCGEHPGYIPFLQAQQAVARETAAEHEVAGHG